MFSGTTEVFLLVAILAWICTSTNCIHAKPNLHFDAVFELHEAIFELWICSFTSASPCRSKCSMERREKSGHPTQNCFCTSTTEFGNSPTTFSFFFGYVMMFHSCSKISCFSQASPGKLLISIFTASLLLFALSIQSSNIPHQWCQRF